MKRLLAALLVLASWSIQASAQAPVKLCISTNGVNCIPVDGTNPLPVSASVSASVSGFPTIQTTGTPISVTTGGVSGTLPSGAVVVATNVGSTNAAYCKLGASATTSDQFIPAGGWFAFTVGTATQLTCITSTSTTTVNMVGGSGLPTGAGGGGSSGGGGGGAVTVADGADVAEGTTTDAACVGDATSGCTVLSRISRVAARLTTVNSTLGSPIQATGGTVGVVAGTAIIGKIGVDQTTPGTTNGVAIVGVNGATALAGTGAVGTGTLRIAVGTDTATIAGSAPGTAGTASANVVTVQGVASMTKLLVTPDSVALPANQSVNVSQVNGVTTLTGTGAVGTGTIRVAVGTDSATVAGSASIPAGTNLMGKVGVDQTTPGTTNAVSIAQIGATTVVNGGTAGTLGIGGAVAAGSAVSGANPVLAGLSDGTNNRAWLNAANSLNSTGAGIGTSQIVGQCDDTTPTALTENQFGNLRMDCTDHSQTMGGIATTAAPSYSTATARAFSLTTAGGLRTDTFSIAGTTALTGNGATGAGSQRVTIANDNSPVTIAALAGTASAVTGIRVCDASAVYDASTNGSTQLVALSSGKTIYVCGFSIIAGGTVNVKLNYGTGSACATGTTAMTPAWQLTAQVGLVDGSPFYRGLATASANALCIFTSAGVAVQAIVYYNQSS